MYFINLNTAIVSVFLAIIYFELQNSWPQFHYIHGSSLTAFPYRYQEFVKTWKLVFLLLSGIWKYTRVDWIYSDSCLQGQQGQTFIFKTLRYTHVSAKIVVVVVVVTMYYNILQLQTSTFFCCWNFFLEKVPKGMYISRVWIRKCSCVMLLFFYIKARILKVFSVFLIV